MIRVDSTFTLRSKQAGECDGCVVCIVGGSHYLCLLGEQDEVLGVRGPLHEEVSGHAGLQGGEGGQDQLAALWQARQLLPCVTQLHIPDPQ